jgi:hypothetical protein
MPAFRSRMPAALKQADKLVHDVLKDDYARKDAASRRALGPKLARPGRDGQGRCREPLLSFSAKPATSPQKRRTQRAMTACDRLAERFQVDRVAVRRACLDKVRRAGTPEDCGAPHRSVLPTHRRSDRRLENFDMPRSTPALP